MAMFLIDTNVMLAASAVHDLSNLAIRAMPQEIELREKVYDWLSNFDISETRIVLDEEGLIRDEYEKNMVYNQALYEQEYGMKVLQSKIDRCQFDNVTIDIVDPLGERIAQLSPELELIVRQGDDRKWVAASVAANILFNEIVPIVYGAETDWFMIHSKLHSHNIHFEKLLPDEWYQKRIGIE